MTTRVTSPVFVGREDALATLDLVLSDAANGRPSGALIAGEAGVGKSRLLDELAARAAERGVRVLAGHCFEVGEGELPYAPIVGALRGLAAELDADELDAVLGSARPELALLVPGLATDDGRPAVEGPALGQARLFELLLGFLGRLAQARPVVLMAEDIQWADRSTRDLLRFLIRSATSERLAIVASYRSDELHRRHALRPFLGEVERDPRVRRVTVEPFSRDEILQQVDAILGQTPEARVVDRLYERSEGNAFFTEELLAASAAEGRLPDSLRDVLLVRVERLGEPAQRVVRVAAGAGRRVDHRLLSAVAGMDGAELLEALREAVAAQVLVTVPGEQEYEFRHALLREAAYDELLPGEREALHVAIAEALTAQPELAGSGATLAGELAYHWHAAQRPALAIPASLAAGKEAERVYAYAEAHTHYERAMAIWDQVAEPDVDLAEVITLAARAAHHAGDPGRAAALGRRALERIDPAAEPVRASLLYERLGRYLEDGEAGDDETRVAYRRAIELMPEEPSAERARVLAADARLLVLGASPDGRARAEEALAMARRVGAREVQASALSSLTVALMFNGLPREATDAGREALALALEVGAPDELERAYANTTEVLETTGHLEESLELTLEGVAQAKIRGGERSWGAFLVAEASRLLVKLGRLGEARSAIEEGLRVGARSVSETHLQEVRAAVETALGNESVAREAIVLARAVDRKINRSMWEAPLAATAAELELWTGDADAALEVLTQSLALMEEVEWPFYSAPLYALAAWSHAERAARARVLRRDDDARAARAAADALVERLDSRATATFTIVSPDYRAWRSQIAAELSRIDGPGDAEAWREARSLWDELHCPLASGYCAWREAEALLAADDVDRTAVRDLLVAALAAIDREARPLREEIEGLARRARIDLTAAPEPQAAGAAPAPTAAEAAGLTPREAEVLALVADGRTNRQIAEALFISGKTVSVHVSRILAKLGASNRGEAGAIARRLGVTT